MDERTPKHTAITHYGEWNEETRKIPALNFFEKYDGVVISCDFSGPYHDWFAPSAKFYTNTGVTYHSGSEIWEWMKSPALFGTYEKLVPENRISTVIIDGHEKGDRLIHQQDMVFFPKDGKARSKGISVRRTIEFVSGPSEIDGQGVDGLQYYVGKTFWDTNVLFKGLEQPNPRPSLLVSVNKTPTRAISLVDQLIRSIGEQDNVDHVANCSTIDDLPTVLKSLVRPPHILICSSQWTIEEQERVNAIVEKQVPGIQIIDIPPGLDEREGSNGILEFLHKALLAVLKRS